MKRLGERRITEACHHQRVAAETGSFSEPIPQEGVPLWVLYTSNRSYKNHEKI